VKKIIRLTESDLTHIVKRVINENSKRDVFIELIKKNGWDQAAEYVGGVENLKKLTGIETTMDFLNLFNDMNGVKSEENPNWILFKYGPEKTMISYNIKKRRVYVNYRDIWTILFNDFEIINESKVNKLITKWLDEVYNIRDVEILRGMARYEYLTDDL